MLLIIITYLLNVYLFFTSIKKSTLFLYRFILINFISNVILTLYTPDYPGIALPIRFLHLALVILFIIKNKLRNSFSINAIAIYFIALLLYYRDLDSLSGIAYLLTFFMTFTAGSALVNDPQFDERLIKLCKSIIIFGIAYIAITLTTGVGKEMYSADITVGAFGHDRINIISFAAVILFAYYTAYSHDKKSIIYILLASLLVLFITKRLAIILLVLGLLFIFIQFKFNIKKLLYSAIAIGLLILTLTFLPDKYIQGRIDDRQGRLEISEENVESDGRYIEYLVLPFYVNDNSFSTLTFGNGFGDTFNYRYLYLGLNKRPIHAGFVYNIYKFGFFGLALILVFFIYVAIFLRRLHKHKNKFSYLKDSPGLLLGFPALLMIIVYNLVDGVFKEFPALILFLLLGKLYGEYKSRYKKKKITF